MNFYRSQKSTEKTKRFGRIAFVFSALSRGNYSVRFMSVGILLAGIFLTPDQQGQRLMKQGAYQQAAEAFEDPMRVGSAWYRAGEFKKAEAAFRQVVTPEADYNRGNCFIFMGQYKEAVKSFDRALEAEPEWKAAQTNREIARIRAQALDFKGGDMGDQKIGADEIKFDAEKKSEGQETEQDEGQPLSEVDMQALWLRRVQTNPSDFLKTKFAYQSAVKEGDRE